MKLHTVFITYNRLELTKQSIETYLATVTVPFTFTIVDNASTDGTWEWVKTQAQHHWPADHQPTGHLALEKNFYPGYACNRGWELASLHTTHLHRADNDMAFLPGWCDEVQRQFRHGRLGQLGLRTNAEEFNACCNVGGNNIILRRLFDHGLRYDEKPWPEYDPGMSEDSYFSPAVKRMGYRWGRVSKPCLLSLATGDWNDEYYRKSFGDRRITQPRGKRYGTR